MKKIGILFGRENTFPLALVKRINEKNIDGIVAEPVLISKVMQADPTEYAVILDRISHDVPFYRGYLKNAALSGTAVINNPFWWSADEKFFNNALAEKIGVTVPKTALFPSNHRPPDTEASSFRNLALPLDYKGIFEYVGFPAFFKPFAGGGWKHVYKVYNESDFFRVYNQTGQLVMMLQEAIDFELYFRCYSLGCKYVHIMQYEPRNPFHERYVKNPAPIEPELYNQLKDTVLKLNEYLGYDFNTVEIAVKDGVLYPIDFCNPAPDADDFSVGPENFEWVLEHAALLAIETAQNHQPGKINLRWGKFIQHAVLGAELNAATPALIASDAVAAAPAKKADAPKAAAPKKEAAPKKAAAPKAEAEKKEAAKLTTRKKKGE